MGLGSGAGRPLPPNIALAKLTDNNLSSLAEFTDSAEVEDLSRRLIWFAAAAQIPGALAFVLDGILIGAGDLKFLAGAMSAISALFVPFALLAPGGTAGMDWLWAGIIGFMAARTLVLGLRFRQDNWLVTGA